MDSSYTKFLKMMRTQGAAYNPEGIEIATVTTADPLTVNVDDLPLDKENLLVSDYLLHGYERTANIPSTSATKITFTDGLKKDDMLAVVKISKLKYLILCKVVSL
ncbi:DUF2577 domain-containing protein [Clostridium tyrobutyricum]|uniref:DUF2577 domain-containing protein n=1 Tax=Clostridium tyrobutyricum TaxID=1519 RepID=UPI001C38ACD6|nr:DUF2577 domain-containing protein [Clostridium tyrobutyricum]MBV4423248.1 DUF2577 domain-containing protein [Clostridium tyrobutyricum]